MTNKPTGARAAARDIDRFYYEWFLDKLTNEPFPEPEERVSLITAIIAKHFPGDKGMEKEKLVEAAIKAERLLRIGDRNIIGEEFKHVINELQATLAEYEKVQQ